MSPAKPAPFVCVLILDGWGIGPKYAGNAIFQAKTPNFDAWWNTYPHTQLGASGEHVGLPKGEDGNTETGHLNLGAGQIVYQDLPRINLAIADGSYFNNPEFISAIAHVKKHNSRLHIMGLVGSGSVHSSFQHLLALLNTCKTHQLTGPVSIHAFTDGRDSPPNSGLNQLGYLQEKITQIGVGQIATVMGRYYAMDRDARWQRTQVAYDALTLGSGDKTQNLNQAIKTSYEQDITDEFVKPIIVVDREGQPTGLINDNDAVIFFNYRIDRPRQLTKAFVLDNFESTNTSIDFDPYHQANTHLNKSHTPADKPFQRQKTLTNLFFVTMTQYEKDLPCNVAFPPTTIKLPLSAVISNQGLKQLKISETEKERFVTYYFNGQREIAFPGEDRHIIPSPAVPTYDLKPEMATPQITASLIQQINRRLYSLIVVNFAAPDMVAHTGNLPATIKACEAVDFALGRIVKQVNALGGVTIITADHGNAEEMTNLETEAVDTEHSAFSVPFIAIGPTLLGTTPKLRRGILADVAPTVLQLLGIPIPESMNGRSFF